MEVRTFLHRLGFSNQLYYDKGNEFIFIARKASLVFFAKICFLNRDLP